MKFSLFLKRHCFSLLSVQSLPFFLALEIRKKKIKKGKVCKSVINVIINGRSRWEERESRDGGIRGKAGVFSDQCLLLWSAGCVLQSERNTEESRGPLKNSHFSGPRCYLFFIFIFPFFWVKILGLPRRLVLCSE